MLLTSEDILEILRCIGTAHEIPLGYSDEPHICRLQGKLSIMLEVANISELKERSITHEKPASKTPRV